jgi:ABC-type protease/lipase transport system fused ATPase/permease subunit
MRALELYGIHNQWKGKIDLETSARPRITLRYLNQLKLQRKRRQREQAAKMPLLSRMYGDWERQELDALSQQISDLDAQGANAEDVEAASRALRKMARRTDG